MTLILQLLNISALISGFLVITAESPIVSVLFLILVFISAACYLILIGLPYIGIVYIVVYVGAIAILFIFILMMINLQSSDIIESSLEFNLKVPITVLLATLFLLQVFFMSATSYKSLQLDNLPEFFHSTINWALFKEFFITISSGTYHLSALDSVLENSISPLQQIQSIGENLYTQNSFWIILSSIIFLLGMISPIVLSRKN